MDSITSSPECLWRPHSANETNCMKFMKWINSKYGTSLSCYPELYQWSIDNYAEFWEEVALYSETKFSTPHKQIIDKTKGIADFPEWFSGATLNFAENILCHNDDSVAIYSVVEPIPEGCANISRPLYENGKNIRQITFAQLRCQVASYANAMRHYGVQKGDRVAGYLPNCAEAVVSMLATASIGAIWSSVSPDFGISGVLDRLLQIKPKLIITVDNVIYNGKIHNHTNKVETVINKLTDFEKVVVIPYVINQDAPVDLTRIKNGIMLEEFLSSASCDNGRVEKIDYEFVPFNHPLYIMFSSGTTGAPKCMVHSVGGTLLKHKEEHLLQGNMRRDDVLMYYTTTGWMMWNWFVSALSLGASIVCYDGSPFVPTPYALWNLVDEIGITILGVSAKMLDVLEEKQVSLKKSHNLDSLHTILSTGSPLKPQSFKFVYEKIKSDVLLGSITGGTDIIGCFAGQSFDLPVHVGEIQCKLLGMAIDSWDEDGKAVHDTRGELVCTKPFPSMPTHFWNDKDRFLYKKAYFEGFPGVWTHGDFCLINKTTGGLWMLGRSDGTLNPNGVRFGSVEIYQIVESFKEIEDSLCVGQRSKNLCEERVILFLKMAPDCKFKESLVNEINRSIRSQLSARHVPAMILPITEIPYTQSGKKVEVAVKRILSGEKISNLGSYANPKSLDLYTNIVELTDY